MDYGGVRSYPRSARYDPCRPTLLEQSWMAAVAPTFFEFLRKEKKRAKKCKKAKYRRSVALCGTKEEMSLN